MHYNHEHLITDGWYHRLDLSVDVCLLACLLDIDDDDAP